MTEDTNMADLPADPDSKPPAGDDTATGTPRWVNRFGIIGVVLVVLLVILLLTGHGPGRHRGGGVGGHTPPAGATAQGAQQL
jgi:hypothetical protein